MPFTRMILRKMRASQIISQNEMYVLFIWPRFTALECPKNKKKNSFLKKMRPKPESNQIKMSAQTNCFRRIVAFWMWFNETHTDIFGAILAQFMNREMSLFYSFTLSPSFFSNGNIYRYQVHL